MFSPSLYFFVFFNELLIILPFVQANGCVHYFYFDIYSLK